MHTVVASVGSILTESRLQSCYKDSKTSNRLPKAKILEYFQHILFLAGTKQAKSYHFLLRHLKNIKLTSLFNAALPLTEALLLAKPANKDLSASWIGSFQDYHFIFGRTKLSVSHNQMIEE